jgi:hypothetical protein
MLTGRRCGGTPDRSAPSSVTRPESARSNPATTRSSVDFPLPDPPSSATNSPAATSSDAPSSAATPPNRRTTSRSESSLSAPP